MSSTNRFRGTPRALRDDTIQWIVSATNISPDPDTDVGPTVTIPTPVGLNVGDLVVVYCYYRGATQNYSISTTGGQTWIPCGTHRSTTQMFQVFFCRFNGVWAANPVFTVGSGTETAIGVMHCFRGELGEASRWALDSSPVLGSGAGTGFTITGVTPQAQRTVSIACVASQDDNEYTLTTPGRWLLLGNKQYRSTGGTDAAITFARLAQNQNTPTGNLTITQATLGADAGITMILTFKEGLDFVIGSQSISRVPNKKGPAYRMFVKSPGTYTEDTGGLQSYTPVPSGGFILDGTITDFSVGTNPVPVGGIDFAGAGTFSAVNLQFFTAPTPTGGITFDGIGAFSVGITIPAPVGGIVFDGAVVPTNGREFTPVGGIDFAGIGDLTRGFVAAPDGVLIFAGAGDVSTSGLQSFTASPTGGMDFAGVGDITRGIVAAPTDGIIFAGAGSFFSQTVGAASVYRKLRKRMHTKMHP